ncbi:MAG: hypothetical protein A3K77_00875 [Euryarchaeota archaeon RBG_13_31_8]|nr:MAG: hypothetical protein A3K77_00875 [Euryarchaeota archaeon RBG_13_31_8]
MSKYSVDCEVCGNSFFVDLFGKTRDRDWKLAHWSWFCDDCKEKTRQEENKKAAESNEKAGLPELVGTEKQITWAETIRSRIISALEEFIKNNPTAKAEIAMADIKGTSSASWWIDSRESCVEDLLEDALKNVKTPEEQIKIDIEKQIEQEVKAEATIRPENPKTKTVSEISIQGNMVKINFPEKRDDFYQLIRHDFGFSWTGSYWKRELTTTEGTAEDRAVEVGNKLLSNGFCIRIIDNTLRDRAIKGEYKEECKKWILERKKDKYKGWFAINWKHEAGDYFKSAKRIPGSRWDKPSVVVPPEQFEEVLGFAEVHGFKFTKEAFDLIEQAKKAKESGLIISIEKKKDAIGNDQEIPELEIPENVEIDDEFKE